MQFLVVGGYSILEFSKPFAIRAGPCEPPNAAPERPAPAPAAAASIRPGWVALRHADARAVSFVAATLSPAAPASRIAQALQQIDGVS
jgi:hypothetical protein